MLTIRAMAEMGPWTLTGIDVLDRRDEQCQRCGTWIRYVWVMQKETIPKEVWRIGSECGPDLEEMVEDLWNQTTRPFKTSVRHVSTLEKLARWERDYAAYCPRDYQLGWAEQQRRRIAAGGLTDHERRVIGSHVSQANTAWQRSIAALRARGRARS